jgi:7,8-didemethyl-8-hydroxy-5-deazariboflavin synthase CofG subunit
LLVGIGESFDDRADSLLRIQRIHSQYSHIQEIIIQPFEPKSNTPMANHPRPSFEELLAIVAAARLLMPRMNIQVPPNLLGYNGKTKRRVLNFSDAIRAAILAGANDFGGISTLTPDFINPERPWPSINRLRAAIERAGFVPRERLPIYPHFIKERGFMPREVKRVVHELADEDGYRACSQKMRVAPSVRGY